MNDSANLVSVKILDKLYRIKCPHDSAHELQQSAEYLNEQMQRLRKTTNIDSTENLAVVAALNITHELIKLKNQKNQPIDDTSTRIQELRKRIEDFLATQQELAL